MSILVHPDKNQDDSDRAQKAFDGKAWNIVDVVKHWISWFVHFMYFLKTESLSG